MRLSMLLVVLGVLTIVNGSHQSQCIQGINCQLPNCFCSTSRLNMDLEEIPQIVYFGFDDALNVEMASHYRRLFSPDRKNPNGCPITMSLYVQDQYTDYRLVHEFYNKGMEIGVHSVTHTSISTGDKLRYEAGQQKKNLATLGRIPIEDIVGWRSPNLKTAGDVQPDILKSLGYTYDISLTYTRSKLGMERPWPYTLDYGYPFSCMVSPCPKPGSRHPGFWEVPVNSLVDYKNAYACAYVDGCFNRPDTEEDAFKYLWQNFLDYYNSSRTPFGFNMHAAWFWSEHNLNAMNRFIEQVREMKNVYIVSVKQMLDWVREPTPISQLQTLPTWRCAAVQVSSNATVPTTSVSTPTTPSTTTTTPPTTSTTTTTTTPTTTTTTTTTTSTTMKPTTNIRFPSTTTPKGIKNTKFITKVHPSQTFVSGTRPTEFVQASPQVSHKQKPPTPKLSFPTAVSKLLTTAAKNGEATRVLSSAQMQFLQSTASSGLPSHSRSSSSLPCIQGWNCRLPGCMCRTTHPPGGLAETETPQMVYFTFDGPVNVNSYMNLVHLFDSARKNPNNCSISATMFVSKSSNYMTYLKRLAGMGMEVGLRGDDMDAYRRSNSLETDLNNEINYLQAKLPVRNLKGWRSPALKPLGDAQFKILKSQNLLYDSTLSLPNPQTKGGFAWPYTLDFRWRDTCDISGCPIGAYPGLWEVPIVPLLDYTQRYPCTYADGCMFNPPTANDTFNFLWQNFKEHYDGNRAPFGVTLRQQWFSHFIYKPNLAGLDRFIRTLVSMRDVYVVSIEQVLDWMKNPTPLGELGSFLPWQC
ncbi:uncharacterized protein [Haliotis cracherodii]|uniref:uncharacterized protein n=1 Tax=Haliotis cracherodii TaxID=6455 RepID=UPI0039EAF6AB